jgi:hypothetical protein
LPAPVADDGTQIGGRTNEHGKPDVLIR